MRSPTDVIAGLIAGAALAWLGRALVRHHAETKRATAGGRASLRPTAAATTSSVEREMEDQAIARAQSELASGEYDMQG